MAGISREVRRLNKAIERDELTLVYQPKADMRSGKITGVEALARWHSPRHGPIGPSEFIPTAERSGATIQALTEWTLNAAMRQAREWQQAGHELTIAVNVSPRSVLDSTLTETIARLLAAWEIAPRRIQLELTETAVFGIADPERVTETLNELSQMGLLMALDDFGTGYSSLSRLRDLPIDKVKIDQSFVMHMDERPQDALIVRSVIALAKSLGLRVVAEGVEREPVWRRLTELGCDVAQGNYLSAPLPPDGLIAWVRQWEELFEEAHRMASELLERRMGPPDRRAGTPDRRDEP
ncbi:MAG: diguanylate cyclase, partial [Thermoleophilaceae bacterium]|nr:diguanylate cyclase [Thermoleophilaceae bacterium]